MARYQVVVVGGGPVGVALAVELGLRGVSCALVERRIELQNLPKGQNLTQRSLEHFARWGIVDQLRAARIMPPGFTIGGVIAYGNLMSDYWYVPPHRELVRPYYNQDNERLPQYQTEKVLRARVAELPAVTALFGRTASAVAQREDGVAVTLAATESTAEEVLEADYVVGCDGARSLVREGAGIKTRGDDFEQLMMLAVFRSKELHEALKRFPPRSTYNVMRPGLNGYWQFFGRVDVGEGWFFHAPVPAEAAKGGFDFQGLIRQAAGFDVSCEFDYVGFWDLRVSVAETYRAGRMFIAGDSAHSHPPYGGFGLNNGLEDAVNLGWKLAARLQGWGSEALLDSYGAERRPVFQETADDFITARIEDDKAFLERHDPDRDRAEFEQAWQARQTAAPTHYKTYEPHYDGSPVIWGAPGATSGARGVHTFAARPGHHLPPQALSSGRTVFEELGQGFTLLAFGADEADVAGIERTAAALDLPLKVIRDGYDGGREAYGERLILVRPDQYVAWAGEHVPEDVTQMLGRAVGREAAAAPRQRQLAT